MDEESTHNSLLLALIERVSCGLGAYSIIHLSPLVYGFHSGLCISAHVLAGTIVYLCYCVVSNAIFFHCTCL